MVEEGIFMTTTPEHEDEHDDLDTRLSRIALDLHGYTPELTIERIAESTKTSLGADGADRKSVV